MHELTPPIIDLNNTPDELRANSRLRICVECGHLKPDTFEFGISCELCGSLFVFHKKSALKRKGRSDI